MESPTDGMPAEYAHLKVARQNRAAVVTLNRPDVLNALNSGLLREFFSAVAELDADDHTAVIVVTGAGDQAFCAGADIKEMARRQDEGKPPQTHAYSEAFWALADCRKPTIGALNGLCYGGGAMVAAALDMRIGSARTRFRFLGASYGRVNSTWLLPQIVGIPAAKELLFSGRVVKAEEACRMGLLNRLVDPALVLSTALELAGTIAENDQRMVRGIKRLLHQSHGSGWRETYDNEQRAQKERLAPSPVRQAFAEFLERKGDA